MKLLLLIMLFSTSLYGQNVFKEAMPISKPKSLLEIRLFQDSFLSDTAELSSVYSNFQVGLKRYSPSGLNIKANMLYAFNESEDPYIDVQDFNISFDTSFSNLKSYLGRRTVDWSEMDKYWGFGVWEPNVRQNPLEPKRQGLTGLFLDLDLKNNIKMTFFGSTISLPSTGPKFTYENNRITSNNPWFHEIVGSVELRASQNEILYDLNIPPYEEMFIQSSYALKFEASGLRDNWFRLSAAHKPINQFTYQAYDSGYSGILKSSIVSLRPTIFYHDIYTMEAGARGDKYDVWLSYSYDKPIIDQGKVEPELDYIDPLYISHIYSVYFDFALSNNHKFYTAYMYRDDIKNLTDFSIKTNIIIGENSKPVQARYNFSELLKVGYKFNLGTSIVNLSYAYSQKDAGDIIKASINYFFDNGISAFSDFVALSYFGNNDQNFFEKNRSNDYLKIGIEYVF